MIFTAPLALTALLLLPVFYLLLRLTPPPPKRLRFPPLSLLAGLDNREQTAAKLPLWLALLRAAILLCLIIGIAGPVWRPPPALPGTGPVLLVVDNGWAAAANWPQITATAQQIIAAAGLQNREVAILATARGEDGTAPRAPPLASAAAAEGALATLQPEPWPTDHFAASKTIAAASEPTRIYIADGITDSPGGPGFLATLHPNRIFAPGTSPALLGPVRLSPSGSLVLHAMSNPQNAQWQAENASGASLARGAFAPNGDATITLPPSIRNQIAKFILIGPPSAAATTLLDQSDAAHTAGLAGGSSTADAPFLGGLYYLSRALPPGTIITRASPGTLLAARPGIICLVDQPLTPNLADAARSYIAAGGILVRFAGPLTAAAPDSLTADPLLQGTRRLGGTLTWSKPEPLAPIPPGSPLAGLNPERTLTISRQVLADPATLDPATIWASLADGTPLILGRPAGQGDLVNILTSANPDWSNLALSGLYPAILQRLVALGHGNAASSTIAQPLSLRMDAFGTLRQATGTALLHLSELPAAQISPARPPGLYGTGSTIALNLAGHIPPFTKAKLPGAQPFIGTAPPNRLGPSLIALALVLLTLDLALSLLIRGKIPRLGFSLLAMAILPATAHAQPAAALQPTLGYISSGDSGTDQTTAYGLAFVTANVSAHSSVQLAPPALLNPSTDDLAFYPLIYWLLRPATPTPSPAACEALNIFMSHGGLLVIDTEGADAGSPGSGAGFAPGAGAALTRITACLDLPPLQPLTGQDVIAHCFYIIPGFPGRFTGAPVLAAIPAARDADGVTPIILTQNDWAGAWARDSTGIPEQTPLPGGDAQRLVADRLGINLVIYSLTGDYKADQAFAPALLDRLGQ